MQYHLPMGSDQELDVFLSYNSRDKKTVRKIGNMLKKRGLKVWFDEWKLVPGRPWVEELEEAISRSRSAAVLVGKDGLGPWEMVEMRACLSEQVDRGLPVIPVLLPGAPSELELPMFLRQLTVVDLRGSLSKEGLDRLVWGIRGQTQGEAAGSEASVPIESEDSCLKTEKSHLRRMVRVSFYALALGLVAVVLSITGIILDLPDKWRSFRAQLTEPTPVASPAPVPTQLLRAEIVDAATHTPLADVRVWLPEYGLETKTNEMGVFCFELPVADGTRVKLRASYHGYLDLHLDPMVVSGQSTFSMGREP
jgi:hypothetical protein